MKLKDWLKEYKNDFTDRDLRFLLKHSLGKDAFELERIGKAYAQGIPLAYILGKEEFFGYEFDISSDVLIPRPETELIVEKALKIIAFKAVNSVLDLCSGSGNIAISLKKASPKDLSVFASDCSWEALRVAELNARKHKVNINFILADLLTGFSPNSFDLIVSNPPYVEDENIKDSLKYEPFTALSGGRDGLDIIKKILNQARVCLKDKGYLIIEIGYRHKVSLDKYIQSLNSYKIVDWIKDYSGHFRGVILEKK